MSLHPRTLLCGTCHISLHDPAICAQVLLELHVCIMKMLLSTKLLSKSNRLLEKWDWGRPFNMYRTLYLKP